MTSLRAALTFFDFVISSEIFSTAFFDVFCKDMLKLTLQRVSSSQHVRSTGMPGDEVMGLCVGFVVDKYQSKDKSNSFKGKCLL